MKAILQKITMRQNSQQNSNQEESQRDGTEINISNYLVTQGINTENIAQEKLKSDLSLITEAEEKRQYKADISKDIGNPQLKRAVSSLKLSNPFKGY